MLPQKPAEQEKTLELITPAEETVEVIKVELLFVYYACVVACAVHSDLSCIV